MVATQRPHGYSGWPGNDFGDVLTRHLNRLPLPFLPLLGDVAQAREGEMKGKYQGLLSRSPVEELTSGGYDLVGRKVDGRVPVGIVQMDRMEHCIGDVQELFAARGNSQRHVGWCVPGCRNRWIPGRISVSWSTRSSWP
ncbi:MAG: hypothetical protein ACE5NG_17375 [bacterium]